jgi:predicted metalloprotease with PDZ domain
MIQYTVSFEKANAHIFEVKLNITSALAKGQTFYLPNWIPGSYMIRDFARNITCLTATSKQSEVIVTKIDKSTWILGSDVDSLELNYQVYAWDLSVRSAHLDNQHGFFNGTSLFLGIKGFESETHKVVLKASQNAIQQDWQVATAMPSSKIDNAGFGEYVNADYDELIDHPFEFGKLELVEFDVSGVPHKMFFTEAPARVDWQRIAKDVKQICETEVKFFGDEKPPFDQYVFMTFVQKIGFGGLEHMASTALHCSYKDLPLIGEDIDKINVDYRTFLSLCCHEYFHNWNVKRIKPAKFIPTSLEQEIHTELLWFFEGITSYYDELLMVRAGVVEPSAYLDMLAQTITKVTRSKGRLTQSVTESSFDTWTKFYKQDENAVNSIVSYYSKGALVAFCLDFEIRKLTKHQKTLDDLMRIIWKQHGKTGVGVGEVQIREIAETLVGESMKDFFNNALYTTQELDLKPIFDSMDINYQIIPQYLALEKGGYVATLKERKDVSFLGITHIDNPLGAQIVSVTNDGCASNSGLSNGDIIVAIENVRVTSLELDICIAKIPLGTSINIHYFRREKIYETQCVLKQGDANTCYLSFKSEKPSDTMLAWAVGTK